MRRFDAIVICLTTVNNTQHMRRMRWTILFWQVFWLNIYLPGHTRGSITVAGSCCAMDAAATNDANLPACCRLEKAAEKQKSGSAPTPRQKSNCAICKLVHGYSLPPLYCFDFRPSGFCRVAGITWSAQVSLLPFNFPFYPVGPPACDPA